MSISVQLLNYNKIAMLIHTCIYFLSKNFMKLSSDLLYFVEIGACVSMVDQPRALQITEILRQF